jgi:hypothetical protein
LDKFISNSIEYLNNPLLGETPNYDKIKCKFNKDEPINNITKNNDKNEELEVQVDVKTDNQIIIEEPIVNLENKPSDAIPIQEEKVEIKENNDLNKFIRNRVLLNIQQMKESTAKRVFVRNEILYQYLWRSNKIKIFESRKEDKMFAFKPPKSEIENKLNKLEILKKTNKFRQLISKRLK